jgi:hypothetical protein
MILTQECKPLPAGWQNTAERFWSKVHRSSPDDCWLWTGNTFDFGHGHFWISPRDVRAHRVAWALEHGKDPAPYFVLHRCDVPRCCNPRHLFTGSKAANSADMANKGRGGRPKGSSNRHSRPGATHCVEGHAFTSENTYVQPGTSKRQCRTCNRDRARNRAQQLRNG